MNLLLSFYVTARGRCSGAYVTSPIHLGWSVLASETQEAQRQTIALSGVFIQEKHQFIPTFNEEWWHSTNELANYVTSSWEPVTALMLQTLWNPVLHTCLHYHKTICKTTNWPCTEHSNGCSSPPVIIPLAMAIVKQNWRVKILKTIAWTKCTISSLLHTQPLSLCQLNSDYCSTNQNHVDKWKLQRRLAYRSTAIAQACQEVWQYSHAPQEELLCLSFGKWTVLIKHLEFNKRLQCERLFAVFPSMSVWCGQR